MKERVESPHFPFLPLRVDVRGRAFEVDALIDTGFDDGVTMPVSFFGNGGPADAEVRAGLADSSIVMIPAYAAEVQVGRLSRCPVVVLALGDEPSVGRRVTDRFLLTPDHGQRVVVET